MTCAKVRVFARLTTIDGAVFYGENVCANPQTFCPRQPGEGYELCKQVCAQAAHAELQAIFSAGVERARGGVIHVRHSHVCADCRAVGRELGIEILTVDELEMCDE